MDPSVSARWLPTVEEGYRHMLAAIAGARDSVRLETYIFKAGGPGDRFRDALQAAAARGVRVRALVDGFGSNDLPRDYWDDLRAAGGEAAFFNPISLRRLVIRDHRKLLVVDEQDAFVGGFNIAPEYEGDGVTRGWRDLGLVVSGSPARSLAATFDVMWAHREFHHPRGTRLRRSRLRRSLREYGSAEVMASGPGLGRNAFRASLMRSLREAHDVSLMAAYFLPGFRLRRLLARVARRGGRVRLLLAGQSDLAITQAAARSLYPALLRAGIAIAEFQPQILHAKLALVDAAAFAGSSNLDARSLGINYEIMVRIDDSAFAAEGRALFDADWARSRPIVAREWKRSRTWAEHWSGVLARFLLTKVDLWLARRQLRSLT